MVSLDAYTAQSRETLADGRKMDELTRLLLAWMRLKVTGAAPRHL